MNKVLNEYFGSTGLTRVHQRIYEEALGNSQPDRKLHLERWDPGYKPQTGIEHQLTGHAPPENAADAQQGSESMRKSIDSKEIDTEPAQLPAEPAGSQSDAKDRVNTQETGSKEGNRLLDI